MASNHAIDVKRNYWLA